MPRIRLLVAWTISVGAGLAIVRLAPVAAVSWQSRRHALQLDAVRVIADSHAISLFRRSQLRQSDSTIRTAGSFPLIEIALRNPAPSISFLTTLDVDVTMRQRRAHTARCAGGPAPWDYDLLVSGERAAERHNVTLSQLVDPGSLHRFVLAIGQGGPPVHAEYEIALTLHYNESGTLPLGRLTLSIDSPACGVAPSQRPPLPLWVQRVRLPTA